MAGFIFKDEDQDLHLQILKDFAYSIALKIPVFTTPPVDIAIGNLYYNLTENKLYVSTGITIDDWHPIALEFPALESIANLSTTGGEFLYTTASNTYATAPISTAGRNFLSMNTLANQQEALCVKPGLHVQPHSNILDTIVSSATTAGKILYTASGSYSTASISIFVRDYLLAIANAGSARELLEVDYLPTTNIDLTGDAIVGVDAAQSLRNKTLDSTNSIEISAATTFCGLPFSTSGTPAEGKVLTVINGTLQLAPPPAEQSSPPVPANILANRIDTSVTVFGNDEVTTDVLGLDTSGLTAARTIFVPDATDTLVLKDHSQTLTEKILTATSNNVTARGLFAGSTTVDVSGCTGPVAGQALVATDSTHAHWSTIDTCFNPARTLFVHTAANNIAPEFNSLNAAISLAITLTPIMGNGVQIIMYPGTYTETVPINIPAFVSITSGITAQSGVVIRPATGGTSILNINGHVRMSGLFINGETFPGSGVYATIGINCTRTSANTTDVVNFCTVFNCTTAGVRVSGNGTLTSKILACTNVSIQTTVAGITMGSAFEVSAGALLLGTTLSVTGFLNAASLIINGVYVHDDYSFADISTLQINTTRYGIVIGSGVIGTTQNTYPIIRVRGAILGQIGTTAYGFADGIAVWLREKSVARLSDFRISEELSSILMHFYSENPALPADPNFIASMWMNARMDKVNILGGAINNLPIMRGSNLSEIPGNVINQFAGDISVGMPSYAANFVSGEGASHIMGMWIFTNTEAGVAVDRSNNGKLIDGSTFPAFPNTTVGSSLYITTNPALGKFPGLKISLAGAYEGSDVRDVIAWEYWNGSAWVDMPLMCTDYTKPYLPHANITFGYGDVFTTRIYNYRFSRFTDWATALAATAGVTIPAGMQNIPRYWLRARIKASGMTVIPVIDQIKLRTNSAKINTNGFLEYFGEGRISRKLPMNCSPVNINSVSSANIYHSTDFNVGCAMNVFPNTNDAHVGFITELPSDVDTSDYIQFIIRWINSEVNNTVVWVVDYGWTTDFTTDSGARSNIGIGSAPESNSPVCTANVSSLAASTIGKLNTSVINIDIQSIIANRGTPGTGDLLWFNLKREASTNNGNATVAQLTVYYKSWH